MAASLPDGRRYELVSPTDKNGGDVLLANTRSRAAVGGEAFQFASLVGFGDVRGTALSTEYIARRTNTGWLTHGITPRQDPMSGFQAVAGPGDAVFEGEFAPDLSAGVVRANAFPQGDPEVSTVQNLFARRDLLSPGVGAFDLVTDSVVPIPAPWTGISFPPPAEIISPEYKPFFAGASVDAGHVIFESILNLTQDTVNAGLPRETGDNKLYEWVNGTVRYVGILPAEEGGGLSSRSIAGQGASGANPFYTHDTISDDGSRIFFTTPDTGQLYMRVDGTSTVRINASEASNPAASPSPAEFRAATPDGTRVFFTSEELLTDDATGGRHLWRYDSTGPARSRLTQLSFDEVSDGHTPPVVGTLGISSDGEWAYFIALGPLVSDMPVVEILDPVIYQWHNGRIRYIGQIRAGSGFEERSAVDGLWPTVLKTSRVTADGKHVLWVTREGTQQTPQDHGSCGEAPCPEVYVFSADANGGLGDVQCVSCDPDGNPATAPSSFETFVATGAAVRASHLVRPLSEDGRYAFFHTRERLLVEDKNDRFDVYEYNLVDGGLSLISSGLADALDSYFMDASASGQDVFFATRDRLVGWDVDGSYDIYDARVGGGFPEPVRPAPLCVGRECQGASGVGPSVVDPTSSGFHGAGNLQSKARKSARRCRRGKVRKRVRGRVRCVRKHAASRGARRSPRVGERRG